MVIDCGSALQGELYAVLSRVKASTLRSIYIPETVPGGFVLSCINQSNVIVCHHMLLSFSPHFSPEQTDQVSFGPFRINQSRNPLSLGFQEGRGRPRIRA